VYLFILVLTQREEEISYEQEMERQRIMRNNRMMRESPMSDEGWPKRKRSDLMAHMTPNHGIRIGLNKKIKMFFGLKGFNQRHIH